MLEDLGELIQGEKLSLKPMEHLGFRFETQGSVLGTVLSSAWRGM